MRKENIIPPITIDAFPERNMKTSYIEKKIYKSPRTNKRPHLLSTSHIKTLKKLPY